MIKLSQNRNNFTGILTDYEAVELGKLITSVGKGTVTGNARIYHIGNGERVKELLKRFGTKYPYSSITRYVGYVTYDCKKFNGNSQTYQRDRLLEELEKVISFSFNDRVKNPQNYINDDNSNNGGGGGGISFTTSNFPDNEKTDNNNKMLMYIGIGVAAFVLFYFMLKK